MKQTFKIIAVSALATAAVIKAAPAFAEPSPVQGVSIVRTADLDLSTVRGRAVLEHRLVIAAYDVCGTAADVDLGGQNDVRRCRTEVLSKARQDSRELASSGPSIRFAVAR